MTDTKHTNIEAALRRGARLHAFLSGGGLRVVRVEDDLGKLIGYGEHPYIGDALQHCDDDIAAGGRDYHEVYGKLHPHYLTGDSTPNSPLDAWVRKGSTFDVIAGEGGFVATMAGYADNEPPEGYLARCIAGETLEWEARGYRYRMTPSRFPGNGEPCASTSVVSSPTMMVWMRSCAPFDGSRRRAKGKGRVVAAKRAQHRGADPWMWPTEQTATAPTLIEALDAALNAEAVEVPRRY